MFPNDGHNIDLLYFCTCRSPPKIYGRIILDILTCVEFGTELNWATVSEKDTVVLERTSHEILLVCRGMSTCRPHLVHMIYHVHMTVCTIFLSYGVITQSRHFGGHVT